MFKDSVRLVLFAEHPVIDISITKPGEFDIAVIDGEMIPSFISKGKFLQTQYCICLLNKLLRLKKAEVKPFLLYQCEQVTDALLWLQKLEKLIDINCEELPCRRDQRHLEKVFGIIEVLRDRIETNTHTTKQNPFDFSELKKKVRSCATYQDKISLLLEAKTEYLQSRPHPVDPRVIPFDEKIQLEIELIQLQISLKESFGSTIKVVSQKNHVTNKAKINCNLNCFVDVFYQFMYEKKANGKPLLETDNATIAEILSENFLDKDGKIISGETIRTILKPSRFEKRPKGNSRIEIIISE